MECPVGLKLKAWGFSFQIASESISFATEAINKDPDLKDYSDLVKCQISHYLKTPLSELTHENYCFFEMMAQTNTCYQDLFE